MQVFNFIRMAFGSRGIVPRSESTCHMPVGVQEVQETGVAQRSALDGRSTSVACFIRTTETVGLLPLPLLVIRPLGAFEVKGVKVVKLFLTERKRQAS